MIVLQVISLESESQGEIPPYGMVPLNWRFSPLGAMAYSVVLDVLLGDGSSQAITLEVRYVWRTGPTPAHVLPCRQPNLIGGVENPSLICVCSKTSVGDDLQGLVLKGFPHQATFVE